LSIEQCVSVIEQWMFASRPRLNTYKTELMWTGTKYNIPNRIRIQSAILPQYTFWTHTDQVTDRPTDGIGDRSTPLALTLAILIASESDELIK